METIHSTAELWATASKGHKKFWQGHIAREVTPEHGERFGTYSTFWQETKDGLSKVTTSAPVWVVGLNVGRSNETTARAQAFLNIESDFRRYKEREGYLEHGETETNLFVKCMLAHKYPDYKDKISWEDGNYAQPKKDGCRFQMNSTIPASNGTMGTAWSRKRVEFHPKVVEMFMFDTAGYTLDGELMLPEGYSQQKLTSAAALITAKKFSPMMPLLEFHVFDIVDTELTFPERLVLLNEILKHAPGHVRVKMLETRFVATSEEFQAAHEEWSANGDEGSILRDGTTPYKMGARSKSLLKHKDFMEDEFTIIDIIDGTGKFEGMAMMKCLLPDGQDFDVTPKGKMAVKAELFDNKDKYLGQPLKVRYQKYSDKGIPIFPIGIAIRDHLLEG